MANITPFKQATFNLNAFAEAHTDLFDDIPKDVQIQQKDESGEIVTKTIKNRGAFQKAVWDDVGGALGQMNRTFYVDSTNGNDNNTGAKDSPFSTIKKACDSVIVAGSINISGEHEINKPIHIKDKAITFITDCSIKLKWSINSSNQAETNGFILTNAKIFIYIEKDIEGKKTLFHIPKNTTGKNISNYSHMVFRAIGTGSSIIMYCRNTNADFVFLNLEEGAFLTTNRDGHDKSNLSLNISGYYGGKFIFAEGTRLIDIQGTAILNLDLTKFKILNEKEEEIDIKTKITGIVRDTNNVPRNVISNIIL